MQKVVQGCMEVHGDAWRCMEMHGGVRKGARRCAEVCGGVQRCTEGCTRWCASHEGPGRQKSGSVQVHTGAQKLEIGKIGVVGTYIDSTPTIG